MAKIDEQLQKKKKRKPYKRRRSSYLDVSMDATLGNDSNYWLQSAYYTLEDDEFCKVKSQTPKAQNHFNTFVSSVAPELILPSSIYSFQEICSTCFSFGNETANFVGCVNCGLVFHDFCISPLFELKEGMEGKWRCLDCLICENCKKPDPEDKLMVCDECQLGFHTGCLQCPLDAIPSGEWKCEACTGCSYCKSKSPRGCGWSGLEVPKKIDFQWSAKGHLCYECAYLTEKGNQCPVCKELYPDDDYSTPMLACDICDRWVHVECDAFFDNDIYQNIGKFDCEYVCPACCKRRPRDNRAINWKKLMEMVNKARSDALTGKPKTLEDGSNSLADSTANTASAASSMAACKIESDSTIPVKNDADEDLLDILGVSELSCLDSPCNYESDDSSEFKLSQEFTEKAALESYQQSNMIGQSPFITSDDIARNGPEASLNALIFPSAEALLARNVQVENGPLDSLDAEFKGFRLNSDAHRVALLKSRPRPSLRSSIGYLKSLLSFCNLETVGRYNEIVENDSRCCVLCSKSGDMANRAEGRLLPIPILSPFLRLLETDGRMEVDGRTCQLSFWVHVKCILFSPANVFLGECQIDVSDSLKKCFYTECFHCGASGASIYLNGSTEIPCDSENDREVSFPKKHLGPSSIIPYENREGCSSKSSLHCNDVLHFRCLKLNDAFSSTKHFCLEEIISKITLSSSLPSLAYDECKYAWTLVRGVQSGKSLQGRLKSKGRQKHQADVKSAENSLEEDFLMFASSGSTRVQGCVIRYGPVIVTCLGYIDSRFPLVNEANQLYPIGFTSYTWYWSFTAPYQRTLYKFEILRHSKTEAEGILKFRLVAQDKLSIKFVASSPKDLMAEFIQKLRKCYPSKSCHFEQLKAPSFFGFGIDNLRKRLEYLPNVLSIPHYKVKCWNPAELKERIKIYGITTTCARVREYEPILKSTVKLSGNINRRSSATDDNTSNSAQGHCSVLPGTKRQLIASQYRAMKRNESKMVRVDKSQIAGMGLYSVVSIEPNQMVIEYVGELVGRGVANKRERLYDLQNKGCYMFKIEENLIVDATCAGNRARFMNHSCDPNCHAKIISVEGVKKVVIYASKHIAAGEEFTYDYKFPLEGAKIPCNCGSRKCRGFMN